jgi:hypothetical protein
MRVGTQHMIDEADLDAVALPAGGLAVPKRWRRFDSGRPIPDVVAALERSRRGH